MSFFLSRLGSPDPLLMDGAMGTMLQAAGVPAGACYELWNLTRPEAVAQVHRAYVAAGAECLVTNTFQANPAALAGHGLEGRLEEINAAAVALARAAAGPDGFVLGSVGPLDLSDGGAGLERVVLSLRPADAILLETWSGDFARAAEIARRPGANPRRLPVLLSLAFARDYPAPGRIGLHPDGTPPGAAAAVADTLGLAALGLNCGRDIGPEEAVAIVRDFRERTSLPILVRLNAGTPTQTDGRWIYPLTPTALAARLPELLDEGVQLIGGCCGTTPEHTAALSGVMSGRRRAPR